MQKLSAQAVPQASQADLQENLQLRHEASPEGEELSEMGDFHYAGSPFRRRDRSVVQLATAPPNPPNKSGLPDKLKSGIEALSGISLDRVRVHYNSPRPAQMQALAYAQGNEIHLAPGQERHLPHEAWHVVQQASGRVRPIVQLKSGIALNDDDGLEHEADLMGQEAMRHSGAGLAGDGREHGAGRTMPAVVQRQPDDAFAYVEELTSGEMEESNVTKNAAVLAQTLANARNIGRTFPLITQNTETFKAMKAALYRKIATLVASLGVGQRAEFVQRWNAGQENKVSLEYYAAKGVFGKYVPVESKPFFAGNAATLDYLAKWSEKKNKDKTMNPDIKLARMIPLILSEPALPEDVIVALKLFFGHTANFVPQNNLGRDFRSVEHGDYYRSSLDPLREGNTALLREHAKKRYEDQGKTLPDQQTFQVINRPLHAAVKELGSMYSNIDGMELFAHDTDGDANYAMYSSSIGSHTGALGLIQNVYKTVQTGTRFSGVAGENWDEQVSGGQFAPLIAEDMLALAGEQNYHDLLLADRSRLVAEVAAEIRRKYDDKKTGLRIVPIQSEAHASLIMELVYPPNTNEAAKLTEMEWRELFIATFNQVAAEQELQTRVTHRGSFGFLYPSASSVGGPVRIWPGLTPPELFKNLVFSTLDKLQSPKGVFQKPDPSVVPPSSPDSVALHVEALKTAVRYAQDVMHETISVKGPPALAEWIAVRLQRNLVKAHVLLTADKDGKLQQQENDFLKSASTIENLMEYSYLLEALRADVLPAQDPYPGYLRKKLAVSSDKSDPAYRDTHTFYLDSGMQAIASAHLLARKWAEKKHGIDPQGQLDTIDLYSYFEYGMIDKVNLLLLARNRSSQGYLDKGNFDNMLRDIFKDGEPAVIAADLNPVLTTLAAKTDQLPYAPVFEHFAKNGDEKSGVIPIVDVTNASLDKAAELNLGQGYQNFIVVESLSKHQQLGADKFTMGRLSAIGSEEFVQVAKTLLQPIENAAYHRLPAAYRLRMDKVFYGGAAQTLPTFAASVLDASAQYDDFMDLIGMGQAWRTLDKEPSDEADQVRQRYVAMKALLNQGLERYMAELKATTGSQFDLQKAFSALPPADQRNLQRQLAAQLGFAETDEVVTENPFLLGQASDTGIVNAGNTCYLAAALNTMAFSPQAALFQPRPNDPKAGLRADILAILDKIRNGQKVQYLEIAALLSALDHAQLLEGPNAFAVETALNAQRDPAEVMEYVLGYFGIGEDPGYQLGQTVHKRIDPGSAEIFDQLDPAGYSAVNDEGYYPPKISSDWMIKLPLGEGDNLGQLMDNYLAMENIQQLTAVHAGQVRSGPGVSKTFLGPETPDAISFQLVRWKFQEGQVKKDRREIDMPENFTLNGSEYRLQAVIYHRGNRADGGHYTTSTLDDEQGWQYRNDNLVSTDLQFAQRKNLGYIYTYAKTREMPDQEQQNEPPNGGADFDGLGAFDHHGDFEDFGDLFQPGELDNLDLPQSGGKRSLEAAFGQRPSDASQNTGGWPESEQVHKKNKIAERDDSADHQFGPSDLTPQQPDEQMLMNMGDGDGFWLDGEFYPFF
ncbi:hypothetical protein CFter6_2522 [Collimonas fungivorans]|uniref:USP domain-containing protein n=1 Tax=Collimonas fungivorans TaxID=158899 RepID=A0A127PC59_9BURK|nr:DUF4157 domain-containing protein [Collimonas fungivorans]AMO95194.1 hypothetical protein CFter6_2522 [Collimonas fungivorans]